MGAAACTGLARLASRHVLLLIHAGWTPRPRSCCRRRRGASSGDCSSIPAPTARWISIRPSTAPRRRSMARSISLTVRWFAMSRPNDTLGLAYGPKLPRLGPLDVHLWYAQPDRLSDPALLSQYASLLCSEEQARHARYRIERVRNEFLVTRALVRTVLSRYTPVEPVEWRFTTNAYGRPDVSSPPLAEPLRFNLSHTRGLIALVTRLEEVGVDVETLRPSDYGSAFGTALFFRAGSCGFAVATRGSPSREVFFDSPHGSFSHRELAQRIRRYARWAQAQGLAPGDVVALFMGNCAEYVAIWLGLTRAGVTVALVNSQLEGDALLHSASCRPRS